MGVYKDFMRIVIGIATYKREDFLEKTLHSLKGQAHDICVYDNNKEKKDYKANAKFIFLNDYSESIYYFTCDDDIIYPKDYVKKSIAYINKYKSIIAYHGDVLLNKIPRLYPECQRFHFTSEVKNIIRLDVAGTGLTSFNTDYFNPKDIYNYKHKNMVDQIFSLKAAEQNKKIILPPHRKNTFTAQKIPPDQTIWGQHKNKRKHQIKLANEIFKIKNDHSQ
jgi:hypothetical protein